MSIKSINVVKKIAQRITSANGSGLVILFDNTNPVPSIPSSSIISVNGFLKNLKGYSKITSTPEVPLPNIEITDSDQERLFATLDIEWKSQRKHLDLLVSPDGNDWVEIGTISLIRQQGYPYRMHSLLDFFTDGLADEFGDNGKVAVKISDVGHGLLAGDDVVTIHGSYLQEIVYDDSLIAFNPISDQMLTLTKFTSNQSSKIVDIRRNRTGLIVFNNSAETIFIGALQTLSFNDYLIRLSAEKGYQFPYPVWTGELFASSENSASLQVTDIWDSRSELYI